MAQVATALVGVLASYLITAPFFFGIDAISINGIVFTCSGKVYLPEVGCIMKEACMSCTWPQQLYLGQSLGFGVLEVWTWCTLSSQTFQSVK